jgi:hypothetical protein
VTADSHTAPGTADAERARLADIRWRRWGPYLAERQWGTVREDYSADGDAWASFPFEHARSRAYRWGEDGLLGICDEGGRLCLAFALWNERDPILKERLFGLAGPEGNHGEDVKEVYWYLDATPTASYLKARYRYPQVAFPYEALRAGNAARTRDDPELELTDTGAFDGGRFFDMDLELAKADADDLLLRVSVTNHGPDPAPIHLLPTLWFRNTWAWGRDPARPVITRGAAGSAVSLLAAHPRMGAMRLTVLPATAADADGGAPEVLVCDNETNAARLWGAENRTASTKDAIGDAVVSGDRSGLLPDGAPATRAAVHYRWELEPGETRAAWLRFRRDAGGGDGAVAELDAGAAEAILAARRAEADAFFAPLAAGLGAEAARVQRQALAGLT